MFRHALCLLPLVLVGCTGPADTPARSSNTTTPKMNKPDDAPKPPAQVHVPTPQAEVEKLEDVPVEELVGKLEATQERPAAIKALAQRGEESMPAMIAALDHENAEVRAAAAFVLGQLGASAESAVAALEKRAKSDDSEVVRDAATFALDAIREK